MSKVILISGPTASGKSTKVKEIIGEEKCLNWEEVNRILISRKNDSTDQLDRILDGVKFILVELEGVRFWRRTTLIEQFIEDDFMFSTKNTTYHLKPYLEQKDITFLITTTAKLSSDDPKLVNCKFKHKKFYPNVEVIEFYKDKCNCYFCKKFTPKSIPNETI